MQKSGKSPHGLTGRYLYAIVPGTEAKSHGGLGINGGRVYTIADGDVAAVVSDVINQKIRPERRHFAAHQGVLKKLMEDTDLLPMSFGIISAGPKAVRGFLERNHDAISTELRRVSGKVEMGLKVSWDVANIFDYMVSTHPELLEARDRLLSSPRKPTQEEKIEIGQLFEELLTADRERHTGLVEDVIGPKCSEVKRNKCRDERNVMNLACLVGRGSLADFESVVLEAAGLFDDNYVFDYNGPWAPHNFVQIEVDV
jgi:hypothetical protein